MADEVNNFRNFLLRPLPLTTLLELVMNQAVNLHI